MAFQFSLNAMPFYLFFPDRMSEDPLLYDINVRMSVYSIWKLSATFLQVSFPSYVFTPEHITSFFRHAPSKPSFASARPYFSVAFVRAMVDVLGTAPGIFPTQ